MQIDKIRNIIEIRNVLLKQSDNYYNGFITF